MKKRLIYLSLLTIVMVSFLLIGRRLVGASEPESVQLTNVRAFAPATTPEGALYVVDAGNLYVVQDQSVRRLALPRNVIAGAVAAGPAGTGTIYVGAANSLALYVSRNGGRKWMQIPLPTTALGGVTALAVDHAHGLVYAGTDNDGVHRLRDVGTSLIATSHLRITEPVEEIAADSVGAGLALVRTEWNLYRAEELGLRWVTVDSLPSPATALTIANSDPPRIYVGTANSGVRVSTDGEDWHPVNQGLGYTPGSQLYVSALAVDPAQPEVVYAATSLIFGSANARVSPIGVAITTNGGTRWQTMSEIRDVQVVEILPRTGTTGEAYVFTSIHRAPVPVGDTPPLAPASATLSIPESSPPILAWIFAMIALAGLVALLAFDFARSARKEMVVPVFRSLSRQNS